MNKPIKNIQMKLRTVRKSDGTIAIQKYVETPKPVWEEIAGGFETIDGESGAEAHIINVLGMDIHETVIATYENNVKTIQP